MSDLDSNFLRGDHTQICLSKGIRHDCWGTCEVYSLQKLKMFLLAPLVGVVSIFDRVHHKSGIFGDFV